MFNKSITMALAVISGLALLSPAKANPVIYNNGSFDKDLFTIGSDFDLASAQQVADDFTLQPHAAITDFHWWGIYTTNNTVTEPDNFTIRIFADTAGAPAIAPLHSINVGGANRTDTGIDRTTLSGGSSDIYEYWVDIAPLKLGGGTFWLSIINDTLADLDDNWFWASSPAIGNAVFRSGDGTAWTPVGLDLGSAFNITGTIPEPASLALFGFGLLGLGLARRRRKAA